MNQSKTQVSTSNGYNLACMAYTAMKNSSEKESETRVPKQA